jgi:Eukaryotic initiation factor 4E
MLLFLNLLPYLRLKSNPFSFIVLGPQTLIKYITNQNKTKQPNNTQGGKWILRLPKGLASRYWEEIIFALMGQQFGVLGNVKNETHEICGAVMSVRYNEDILGIWNRNAHPHNQIEIDHIRTAIQKILQLPSNAHMEYKPHETALQDRLTTGTTTSTSTNTNTSTNAGVGVTNTTTTVGGGPHATTTTTHGARSHETTTGSHQYPNNDRRRSGSWTERDRIHHHNNNSTSTSTGTGIHPNTTTANHNNLNQNHTTRGSWRS